MDACCLVKDFHSSFSDASASYTSLDFPERDHSESHWLLGFSRVVLQCLPLFGVSAPIAFFSPEMR